jgi:UDP-N-acetylglucosamine--N-acetylmuramyl-(pentapeptide) pyrophosphoryl-undecaprenol N-acetylglucosamine transferase
MRADPPGVAASFGGYASVPGAAAALSLGVPLVIHEQNVIPGLANRLLAPWARILAVSFAHTLDGRRSWKKKGVVTGNPLLMPVSEGGSGEAREYFGLEEARMTLAVVGGSQGAASLNRAVLQALAAWKQRRDLQIVHSVGRDKYEEFAAEVAKVEIGGLLYRPLEFVERMDLLYRAADLMVCRAGATTVAELAAAGCPAVLVPYPHATAAHQDANAGVLEKAGAAVVVEDGSLNGRLLEELVDSLMADAGRLREMGEAARAMGRPGAASILAELLLSQA